MITYLHFTESYYVGSNLITSMRFGVRKIWIWILVLPFISYVTLNKHHKLSTLFSSVNWELRTPQIVTIISVWKSSWYSLNVFGSFFVLGFFVTLELVGNSWEFFPFLASVTCSASCCSASLTIFNLCC